MPLEGRRVGVAAVEDGVDRRLGLGAPRQRQRERRAPPDALAVMSHQTEDAAIDLLREVALSR